jgi:hypothetical protein
MPRGAMMSGKSAASAPVVRPMAAFTQRRCSGAQRQRSCGRHFGPFFDVSGYEVGARFVRVKPVPLPYLDSDTYGGDAILDVSLTPAVRVPVAQSCRHALAAGHQPVVFLVGTFVGLSRPRDELPRLLALASLPSAAMLTAIAIQPSNPFLGERETYLRLLIANVYPFHYLLAYGFFFRVAAEPGGRPFGGPWSARCGPVGIVAAAMRTTASVIDIPESRACDSSSLRVTPGVFLTSPT